MDSKTVLKTRLNSVLATALNKGRLKSQEDKDRLILVMKEFSRHYLGDDENEEELKKAEEWIKKMEGVINGVV